MQATLIMQPENVNWLAIANKYIENQWELQKMKWSDQMEMVERKNFDKSFISEFDFLVDKIK
tara:strand:+ start:15979 stop:16164 length:186 start_codon:yes stop_codon:yes gene_type:complete